jgi:hypothetical protein
MENGNFSFMEMIDKDKNLVSVKYFLERGVLEISNCFGSIRVNVSPNELREFSEHLDNLSNKVFENLEKIKTLS